MLVAARPARCRDNEGVGRVSRDEQFRQLVVGQAAGLRRLAYAVSGDWHRADDLVQGTLERAYVRWARVEAADDAGAYLRSMLFNLAISERRRPWRRRERLADTEDRRVDGPDPGAEAAFATALDRVDLASVLAGLTAKQRAVVVLRHLEDRPVREVAAVLGVSEGTVKRQLHDAVAHLARLLAPTTTPVSAAPGVPSPPPLRRLTDTPTVEVPHA